MFWAAEILHFQRKKSKRLSLCWALSSPGHTYQRIISVLFCVSSVPEAVPDRRTSSTPVTTPYPYICYPNGGGTLIAGLEF
jgi:hypothetical protein